MKNGKVKNKKELIETLQGEADYLQKEFGVDKISIFGSFARDEPRENSDVDIFLTLGRPLGLKFVQLSDYLEKRLGRAVDILTPDGLSGIRIKRIAEKIHGSLEHVAT